MEGQSPGDERSRKGRGRQTVGRVTAPLTSARNALTGRSLEQKVGEYSETFTHVVLGLHEDMAAASRRIEQLETTASKLADDLAVAKKRGQKRVSNTNVTAAAALAISVIAAGIAVWAVL